MYDFVVDSLVMFCGVGDSFVVNSVVVCGCFLVVHSWMNHSLVVCDDLVV